MWFLHNFARIFAIFVNRDSCPLRTTRAIPRGGCEPVIALWHPGRRRPHGISFWGYIKIHHEPYSAHWNVHFSAYSKIKLMKILLILKSFSFFFVYGLWHYEKTVEIRYGSFQIDEDWPFGGVDGGGTQSTEFSGRFAVPFSINESQKKSSSSLHSGGAFPQFGIPRCLKMSQDISMVSYLYVEQLMILYPW